MHESLIIPSCTHARFSRVRRVAETEIRREREANMSDAYASDPVDPVAVSQSGRSFATVCAPPILNVCRQFQRKSVPRDTVFQLLRSAQVLTRLVFLARISSVIKPPRRRSTGRFR